MSSKNLARSTVSRKRAFKTPAVSLNTFLENHFGDEDTGRAWLSKALKITKQQADRWLDNDTLVADNVLYLCKSSFKETDESVEARNKALAEGTEKPVDLETYIEKKFDNNQTMFASQYWTRQQQVNRWVNSEQPCVFFMGQVYRARIMLPDPKKAKA